MKSSREERARERAGAAVIAAAKTFRDVAGEVVLERFTRPKYDDAVGVAIGILDKNIGVVSARTKPRGELSQKEAQTIDFLKDIRAEMRTAFEERWNNRERPVAE
jgi:hypothetical protein